jgi:hypothetical protein
MALSDMTVFNDFAYLSFTETIVQQVRLFNEASNGALVLRPARNIGDFDEEAFFANISGLVRRRDAYGSGSVSPVDLSQLQRNTVKVAGGSVPVRWTPQQFSWVQQNQERAGTAIGEQFAEGVFQDYLNSAIAALVAAISNQGSLTYDATGGTLDRADLVQGAALFGDRASRLRAWIVHSKPMHDLLVENVTNAERLFTFGNVNVMDDGFGRPLIMTDSPDLITSGSPDTYHTIGLTEMGAMVEDNGDLFTNIDTENGNENIVRTWQAEYTFNLGLKGYSWDESNGGASPTDAELATGTNWDQVATFDKDTAGVLVDSQ